MKAALRQERALSRCVGVDEIAIELCGVTKVFGRKVAVQPTDLAVNRKEFFSILGPSGCGKTTLMRMIAGFEAPSAGTIRLDGTDATGVPTRDRDLNMLFQSYALFPHLSVEDNVAFELRQRGRHSRFRRDGRLPRQDIAETVSETIELVRLTGLEQRRPNQLSGGQRQRAALARAIVARPSILLLDEPLGALDLQLRREMQKELTRLQRDVGITFVYVTHDQEEALTMSDRIAVMEDGGVQQVGTPADVYARPANRFVAGFIGTCNLLDVLVTRTAGGSRDIVLPGIGRVPGAIDPDSAQTGPATLIVRPEDIRVTNRLEPEGQTWVDATVKLLVFHGDEWQVLLGLQNGSELSAKLSSGDLYGDGKIDVGQQVLVNWPNSAARVLWS